MSKPKHFGFRFLKYDFDANYTDDIDFKTFRTEVELYYDVYKKRWANRNEYTGSRYPACFPCRSLKAAKRHLRKHDEIPKGIKFRLVSSYIGCDLYLIKK